MLCAWSDYSPFLSSFPDLALVLQWLQALFFYTCSFG
jgi:hypothetical protein